MSGGGDSATKEQEQLNTEEGQKTMAFQDQLMSLFKSQYATQQGTLSFLSGILKPVISDAEAGKGFTDQELASMRTSAQDQLTTQEQNAQKALNQTLKTSGDANIPSGVTVGANEALQNSEFQANAGAQNQITVANAQQSRSNLFNAVSALSGVSAQESPNALESGALEGGGTVASLSNAQSGLQGAITNAGAHSFFGELGNAFAGQLGKSLGGGGFNITPS